MLVDLPYATLVALVADRLANLAFPPSGEPCPVQRGADPAEWARLGGIGCDPDPVLLLPPPRRPEAPVPSIDPGGYEPSQLAHAALQRLKSLRVVEAAGSCRYRPVHRG
jgi:hypothetical protein